MKPNLRAGGKEDKKGKKTNYGCPVNFFHNQLLCEDRN
jgi:hypothetical protein